MNLNIWVKFFPKFLLHRGTIIGPNKIPNCLTNWMCRRHLYEAKYFGQLLLQTFCCIEAQFLVKINFQIGKLIGRADDVGFCWWFSVQVLKIPIVTHGKHQHFLGTWRVNLGAAAYQLGNTSSCTITEVKQR